MLEVNCQMSDVEVAVSEEETGSTVIAVSVVVAVEDVEVAIWVVSAVLVAVSMTGSVVVAVEVETSASLITAS